MYHCTTVSTDCFEPQAKGIAKALEAAHDGETAELLALRKRTRLCQNLQTLTETPKLHSMEDFQPLIMSVKEYWPIMPVHLKAKITWSRNHVFMDMAAKAPTQEQKVEAVKNLVSGHVPSTGCSWDGECPQFSDLLNEVFVLLEESVMNVAAGSDDATVAADKMAGAASTCTSVLQAHS